MNVANAVWKSSKALNTFILIVVISVFYMANTFYRTHQVIEQTEDYFWNIQAMRCSYQQAQPVFAFSETEHSEPAFVLRFSKGLNAHFTQQKTTTLPVKSEVFGYLWEWDYGRVVVKSIAGKRVRDSWRISKVHQQHCTIYVDEEVKNRALATVTRLR